MTDELLSNIKRALNKPVEIERVVYLMVEIRKLIDRGAKGKHKWPTLKYWCDWTVHTQIEWKFAKDTLTTMEQFIIENPGQKFQWSYFNSQFTSLESLRWELFQFLQAHGLPTEITNLPQWNDFSKYLVNVLRDCPLVKPKGLVRKFFFSQKPHIPEASRYSIDYELHFDGSRSNLQGKVLRFEHKKPNKPS